MGDLEQFPSEYLEADYQPNWLAQHAFFQQEQQQNNIPNLPINIPIEKSEGELRIHNVLALATLEMERKVDLDEIIPLFTNATFTLDGFASVRVEIRGSITDALYTISLFEGGRIQSAGGCMPREAGICMKKVARRIRSRLGVRIKFTNFEVHNLLAVIDLGCEINLPKLFALGPGQKDYEPEKFPALRVSMPVPPLLEAQSRIRDPLLTGPPSKKSSSVGSSNNSTIQRREAARLLQEKKKKVEAVTASIFSNGKINFVGGKSVRSLVAVIEELRPFIEACS